MKLTENEVRYVAALARLELSPEEQRMFGGQLSQVLDYINTLNELDTSDVEPMSHALNITNVFREDVEMEKFPRKAWQANAPSQDSGHFRVPKIIEG
ncbi:MAG: Asp-tRNA(Asn)/Glu-tRNA(Gln) amidotransferase subunit GatC [Nitrospinota bacterium]|nr:Asp-tRNA(Asn)/Glu-tRNA(Gln) amidotransferase subunit GatC [Nitrospinota bacterium]MDH5678978.1 Asp-tRNA(Asn)/Glu-tRNA(Gln) amidotransferase subunit GatC [Nitrospinota bacterium]